MIFKPNDVMIYADGFMKSKKEHIGGCSVAVFLEDKRIVYFKKYFDDCIPVLQKYVNQIPQTNNTSEYFSLIYALLTAKEFYKRGHNINIHIDSELLVNHMNDYAECNTIHLRPMYRNCKKIYDKMKDRLFIQWVTRNKLVEILGH